MREKKGRKREKERGKDGGEKVNGRQMGVEGKKRHLLSLGFVFIKILQLEKRMRREKGRREMGEGKGGMRSRVEGKIRQERVMIQLCSHYWQTTYKFLFKYFIPSLPHIPVKMVPNA